MATKSAPPLNPGITLANVLFNEAKVKLSEVENQILNVEAVRTGRHAAHDRDVAKMLEALNAADNADDIALTDLNKTRRMILASIEAFGPVEEAPAAE